MFGYAKMFDQTVDSLMASASLFGESPELVRMIGQETWPSIAGGGNRLLESPCPKKQGLERGTQLCYTTNVY